MDAQEDLQHPDRILGPSHRSKQFRQGEGIDRRIVDQAASHPPLAVGIEGDRKQDAEIEECNQDDEFERDHVASPESSRSA
ncbi:MAG: hypothetical protein P8Y96_03435 [Desulfuromonadales bacterium]